MTIPLHHIRSLYHQSHHFLETSSLEDSECQCTRKFLLINPTSAWSMRVVLYTIASPLMASACAAMSSAGVDTTLQKHISDVIAVAIKFSTQRIDSLMASVDELAQLRTASAKREAEQAVRIREMEGQIQGLRLDVQELQAERDNHTENYADASTARMSSLEGTIKAVAGEQLKMQTVAVPFLPSRGFRPSDRPCCSGSFAVPGGANPL